MNLGELWIASEEIERIAWEDGELTLELRWSLEEVPVLLGLEGPTLLRWHEDDREAGIPVQLKRWKLADGLIEVLLGLAD